jgi:molybdopterin-biosynthesis enzyme MoeA-like protein
MIDVSDRSIIFSEVELITVDNHSIFYAPGCPDEFDIEEQDGFIDFIENLDEETDILVHVNSYIFGTGESDIPFPDELEYIVNNYAEIESKYGIGSTRNYSFSYHFES